RVQVDRAGLREFGDQLQTELTRLEENYERDLAEIAAGVRRGPVLEIRAKCAGICGIRQCSIVPLSHPSTLLTSGSTKLATADEANQQLNISVPSEASDRVPDVIAAWSPRPDSTGPEITLD